MQDLISRQAVLDGIDNYIEKVQSTGAKDDFISFEELVVKDLPSVQPKPKTGHWILTDDDFVYCSECEDSYYPRPIDASWYYCPHCGCRMVESQESEG